MKSMYAVPIHLVLITLLGLGFFLDKPRVVSFQDISFELFEPESQKICLRYHPVFHNPRPVPFGLDFVEAEVWLDGIYMGRMQNPLSGKAKPDTAIDLDICQDLRIMNMEKILAHIHGVPTFKLEIKGKCQYSWLGYKMDAEYVHNQEVVSASIIELWEGNQYALIQ